MSAKIICSAVEEFFCGDVGRVRVVHDRTARIDEPSPQRVLRNDFRVIDRMRGNLDALHKLGDIRFAADFLKLVVLSETLDEEREVDAEGLRLHVEERLEDATVFVEVEIRRSYNRRHVVAEVRIEQNRSDNAAFCVKIAGRRAIDADRQFG